VPRESLPDGTIFIAVPRSQRRVVGSQLFDGVIFDEAPPYTRGDPVLGDLSEFIGRWAGWLANASGGQWIQPSTMPELTILRNWRT
jgi:hypothetical protein